MRKTIGLPQTGQVGLLLSGCSLRFDPCCSKAFAVTAFFNELAFERTDLLVKQVICLMDQADERIGDYHGIIMIQPARVQVLASRIRLIRRHLLSDFTNFARLRVVFNPLPQSSLTQKILIVE